MKRIADNQCREFYYRAMKLHTTVKRWYALFQVDACISSNGSDFSFCILRSVTIRRILAIPWQCIERKSPSHSRMKIVTKKFSSRGNKVYEQFIAMDIYSKWNHLIRWFFEHDMTWVLNAVQYFLNFNPRLQYKYVHNQIEYIASQSQSSLSRFETVHAFLAFNEINLPHKSVHIDETLASAFKLCAES